MSVSQVGGEHGLHLNGKEDGPISASGHMSLSGPTPDNVRQADTSGDVGEHITPDAPAGHDRPAAELDEVGNGHRRHNEEENDMDEAPDIAMGAEASHGHVDDVDADDGGHQLEAHADHHPAVADETPGIVAAQEHPDKVDTF